MLEQSCCRSLGQVKTFNKRRYRISKLFSESVCVSKYTKQLILPTLEILYLEPPQPACYTCLQPNVEAECKFRRGSLKNMSTHTATTDDEDEQELAPNQKLSAQFAGSSSRPPLPKGLNDESAYESSAHIHKRRRVTRACDECRRKKIKCDGWWTGKLSTRRRFRTKGSREAALYTLHSLQLWYVCSDF